jgi:hypothetical protein
VLRSRLVAAVGRLGVAAAAGPLGSGCYTYSRVESAGVPLGQEVVVELNDQARVDLAGAVGQAPFRLEGRLTERTDTSVVLSLRSVETLRGERVTWTGETVAVRSRGVTGMRQRRLDRGRSVLLAVGSVAAVVALVAGVSLTGAGGGGSGGGPGNPPVDQ